MGSVNYKPNKRVARQILTSQLAYAAVNDGARKLRDRVGEGFHTHQGYGSTRARAYVSADSGSKIARAKLRDHALERVLGSLPPSTKD